MPYRLVRNRSTAQRTATQLQREAGQLATRGRSGGLQAFMSLNIGA
jgi:hypothetical protein